jgi:hypothetical protein
MNKNRILLTALTAIALTGCPSNPVVTPDAGHDAAMPPTDTGPTDDVGNDAFVATPDTGVHYTNDCSGYCMATLAACSGDNAQYLDMADCMATCTDAAWPAGTEGATSGNTIACRIYHAGVAVGTPTVHCPHTGATGGGVCAGTTPIFRTGSTGYVRVDRMGMPAVSTALVASDRKDAYNDGTPLDDISLTMFSGDLLGGLGGLHAALNDDLAAHTPALTPCSMTMTRDLDMGGPIPPLPLCAAQFYAPMAPVVSLLLPDALTVRPGLPSGFPNGRRLQDPAIDITLAVILLDIETTPGQSATSFIDTTTGDGALSQLHNDVPFLTEFPYFAPAH